MALEARPFLVKPNALEASEALGIPVETPADAARAALQLCASGIQIAAISLGADGLVLARHGEVVHAVPPQVHALSSVGAGDAALAGILWALAHDLPVGDMARWGAACGTAAAMRPGTDFAPYAEVHVLAAQVAIHPLS